MKALKSLPLHARSVWKGNFKVHIHTQITCMSINDSLENSYELQIQVYNASKSYYVACQKTYPPKNRALLEKLCWELGEPSHQLLYKINSDLFSLYNHPQIVNNWKSLKKRLAKAYTGEVASDLITLTEKCVCDETTFTQQVSQSVPDGLVLFILAHQYTKKPDFLKLCALPNGHSLTIPVSVSNSTYNGQTESLTLASTVKKMFLLEKDPDKPLYNLKTEVKATLNKRDEAWEDLNCHMKVSCDDIYEQSTQVHLSLITNTVQVN